MERFDARFAPNERRPARLVAIATRRAARRSRRPPGAGRRSPRRRTRPRAARPLSNDAPGGWLTRVRRDRREQRLRSAAARSSRPRRAALVEEAGEAHQREAHHREVHLHRDHAVDRRQHGRTADCRVGSRRPAANAAPKTPRCSADAEAVAAQKKQRQQQHRRRRRHAARVEPRRRTPTPQASAKAAASSAASPSAARARPTSSAEHGAHADVPPPARR